MKITRKILILFNLLLTFFPLFAQKQLTEGIWKGHIHIGEDSLALVLVLAQQNDSLVAVLDSPDQFTTDLEINEFVQIGDTICFTSNSIGLSFDGILTEDGSIKGKVKQNGKKRKITLFPTTERQLFLRPQEPQPPLPYQEQDLLIRYDKGGFPIKGTLTLPTAQTPKAVVVLISGSGWQDRDEKIYNHKPFKLLADQLTRAGYVVFRYDDPPMKKFAQMNTFDLADVADTVVNTLQNQLDLEGLPIGLLGHSEGGLIAWMLASKRTDINFVITLAGPAIPMDEIILYQSQLILAHKGADENSIRTSENLNRKIYAAIKRAKSPTKAGEKVYEVLQNMTDEEKQYHTLTPLETAKVCAESSSNWFYTVLRINPAKFLKKVRCPLLALNGSKDSQVEAATNLAAITALQKKNPNASIQLIDGANHLFQMCETGMSDEYANIEQTMSPTIFPILTKWLDSVILKR